MVGDILVEFNGKTVADHDELVQELFADLAGKKVTAKLLRGGKPTDVKVEVGSLENEGRRHYRGHHGQFRHCCG